MKDGIIQKFEVAADAWCDQNLPANWTDDVDKYLPIWNAKFAELIVRECAEVCKKQSFHYAEHNNKGSAASAADACRILINLHFGVEE